MADIGQAYVQIVPSAKGIKGSVSAIIDPEASSAGKSAGESSGKSFVSSLKGIIAAAGLGAALKATLDAGGAIQQSFGGLDTLYGEASDAAKEYAKEAAKAGISANDYAEQAVSFGASLKQAFEGDTTKAVEAANTAIMDMADNAAKMGTPLESIQNAYQGFAKQNYTMLDNLKLGYGGTKTEMERLLADASKLSGVEYDISNLGDVYEAIHVIQKDLNLTGVAAQEASETFTGSLGSMKAAGQNLLANLALGEDIAPSLQILQQSIQGFVFNNMFPMIANIVSALPELLTGLTSTIIGSLNIAANNAEQILQIGIDLVTGLVEAIVQAAPYLVEAAWNLITALGTALIETDWVSVANNLMANLRNSIDLAASEILGTDGGTIQSFLDSITAGLPQVLQKGVEVITNIVNGILSSLPSLIRGTATMLQTFITFLVQNAPTIIKAGMNLLMNLVKGILDNLPEIISAVVELIGVLLNTIVENLPQIIEMGFELVTQLVVGLINALPDLIAGVWQLITGIVDTFENVDWLSVGTNMIQGVINGIKSMAGAIWEAAKGVAESAFNAAKSALGIASPAKKGIFIGEMLDEGFALGVEKNTDIVDDAVSELANASISPLLSYSPEFNTPESQNDGGVVINMTINGAEGQDVEELARLVEERINESIIRRRAIYA